VERSKEAGAQQLVAETEDRKQKAEAAKIAATQAQLEAQAEAERKQSPAYAQSVVEQYDVLQQQKQELIAQKRKIVDASPTADADRAFNTQITQQLKELGAQIKPLASEYTRAKTIVEQEAEKTRVGNLSPEEYMLEQTQAVPTNKFKKASAPDLAGYYEQQIAAPTAKVDPLQQYVAQRLSLMQQQSPTTDPEDYVNYLMQDPDMARQVLANRVSLPGFNRKELNKLYDDMQLKINEIDEQQTAQTDQRVNLLNTQLAGQDNANLLGAAKDRGPGAVPEMVALRNIGDKNRAPATG